jgi:DNA-binding NarL/FixJ family response regulator
VLLVEDLKGIHDAVLDLLNTYGDFTLAGSASTEAEAKLWLEEHPADWDLAIIDLVLAQGTGMGVIQSADAPGTHVVVFSDYVSDGIRAHCLRLGADAIFQKGSQVDELMQWCARLAAA